MLGNDLFFIIGLLCFVIVNIIMVIFVFIPGIVVSKFKEMGSGKMYWLGVGLSLAAITVDSFVLGRLIGSLR